MNGFYDILRANACFIAGLIAALNGEFLAACTAGCGVIYFYTEAFKSEAP